MKTNSISATGVGAEHMKGQDTSFPVMWGSVSRSISLSLLWFVWCLISFLLICMEQCFLSLYSFYFLYTLSSSSSQNCKLRLLCVWLNEIAQQVEALLPKLNSLSSVSWTQGVVGEDWLLSFVLQQRLDTRDLVSVSLVVRALTAKPNTPAWD